MQPSGAIGDEIEMFDRSNGPGVLASQIAAAAAAAESAILELPVVQPLKLQAMETIREKSQNIINMETQEHIIQPQIQIPKTP